VKNFNDPILETYIYKAIEKNHDAKSATIAVNEYYQATRMQFGQELPQINGGFGPSYSKFPGSSQEDWGFGLPLIASYEVDLFLKNRDKTKSVKKRWEASIIDERAAYISIVSAVGSTYLNIVKLDKMIENQEKIVEHRSTIYDLMLLRHREGITSTSDTVKANKLLVAGTTNLIELKKTRKQLLHQLATLIGESAENSDELVRTPFDEISFSKAIPTEISSEVIVQRPDYLKAEKMLEKAGIDVRIARKELLPSINIAGLALFNANDIGSLFTTSNMLWGLGAGIGGTIFSGGSKIANLKMKKHEYERIFNNYQKTNLVAIQEINDSLVSIKLDQEKLEQNIKQINLEKEDYSYNEQKYNEGIISKLDLLQLEENVLTIENLVASNKIDCMIDYIGLYKATGSNI